MIRSICLISFLLLFPLLKCEARARNNKGKQWHFFPVLEEKKVHQNCRPLKKERFQRREKNVVLKLQLERHFTFQRTVESALFSEHYESNEQQWREHG